MGRFIKQELPPRGSLAEIQKEVFDSLDEEEQNFVYQLADELHLAALAFKVG